MGFVLRAGLVIGLIAYASAPDRPERPGTAAAEAGKLLDALPADLRARVAREAQAGLARAAADQLQAHLQARPREAPPARDEPASPVPAPAAPHPAPMRAY
ncbi:hypothetical protein [Methylobacterium sp. WSM2598]|uniref:hypothetical protein n=1 Tax=Methylobacterium sp. WSM2598 TaxID=398261 RepID=UPI0003813251|nr:hypothetical protein [Methylobacterium sp. WSM2598]